MSPCDFISTSFRLRTVSALGIIPARLVCVSGMALALALALTNNRKSNRVHQAARLRGCNCIAKTAKQTLSGGFQHTRDRMRITASKQMTSCCLIFDVGQ